jgi:hypothetical protein
MAREVIMSAQYGHEESERPTSFPVGPAPIMTQKEAAGFLRVSVAYLRASSCPKLLLQGNGPRGRATVRYSREDVLAWATRRRVG